MTRRRTIGLMAGVTMAVLIIVGIVSSADSSRLTCEGVITLEGDTEGLTRRPATLAAAVETPRWFAVWNRSDAKITWEIQPGRYLGEGYIAPDPFRLRIVTRDATYRGSWSPQSKRISVKMFPDRIETFAGTCSERPVAG